MITIALCAVAVIGYLIGRARPLHRAVEWASWQNCGQRPTGARYAAMWALLAAEATGLLASHPVQGWHAWKHRNDPPLKRSPAPTFDPDWAANRPDAPEEPQP